MKKTLLSLIILSIALPVISQQMDKVDSAIYECMEKHYAQYNIDLNLALDSIEFELIKQKAINSSDSEGIKEYYTGITNGSNVPRIHYTPLMDSVIEHYHFQGNLRKCIMEHPNVNPNEFEKSNYVRRQMSLKEKTTQLGGVNQKNASRAIIEVYSPEDFSTDLFRAHFLLSILATADFRVSYLRKTK